LGRQPQARLTRWRKRRPLSRSSPRVSPVRSACNARSAPLPSLGSTCGRREREADDEYPSGSNPRGLVIATVEGTWSGGSRRPSRGSGTNWILAGPSRSQRVSSLAGGRAGDHGCPEDLPRRGTSSACRQKRMHPTRRLSCLSRTGTRPWLGPRTRARRSSLYSDGEKPAEVTRPGRYRGRANLRKQKEPAPRSARADDARLAARHRFLKRSRVMRQKRKEVAASVPARIEELGSKCPHVGNAVAEVGRR